MRTEEEIVNALWPSQSRFAHTVIQQSVYRDRRKFDRRFGTTNRNLIENVKGQDYRLLHGFKHANAA